MSAAVAAQAGPFAPAAPDALAGRVILVTGAHGGLGEAAAKACAQAGATVVLLGRKVPKLSKTYDAVKALGPVPAIYPLDLAGADPADYETLAERVVADLGGLHGILHCAAEFTGLRPLEATPPEDFVRNLHVNLTAPWLLSQACLPALRAQPDSAIVFVLDEPARVQRAYWGAVRRGQGGLAGPDARARRRDRHRPGARERACSRGRCAPASAAAPTSRRPPPRVPTPLRYGHACVHLLSPAGASFRGDVLADPPPA